MGKLDGKVAIVTGASRGIGKATAKLFAAEGARVACAARTLGEGDHILEGSLTTTVSEIEKAGGTAVAVQVDISQEESCDNLVAKVRETFGPIDVLVNNAALTYFIPVKDYPVRRWLRSFAVNFHGPFMLSQKVLPDMIERGNGSIVNISSGAAIGPGRGPYTEAATGERGGTVVRCDPSAGGAQQGGLAGAVGAQQHDGFSRMHLEGDVVEHQSLPERLPDAGQVEKRRGLRGGAR